MKIHNSMSSELFTKFLYFRLFGGNIFVPKVKQLAHVTASLS